MNLSTTRKTIASRPQRYNVIIRAQTESFIMSMIILYKIIEKELQMYEQNVESKGIYCWYRNESMQKVYRQKGRIKRLALLKYRRISNQMISTGRVGVTARS